VDELLVERYRDYRIIQTTQGYSGDIIDWVDSTTIPGGDVEPPPAPWTEEDLLPSHGAEFARTELELYPELRGPEGTTPIHRPDFSTYVLGLTDATSLRDYLENYQVAGQPSGQKRLYAGLIQNMASKAMAGVINQFAGDVEAGTFSLIEMAVFFEMGPRDTACYTRSALMTTSTADRIFYLGGPGGDAPGCN
jgi:hypothetical protein